MRARVIYAITAVTTAQLPLVITAVWCGALQPPGLRRPERIKLLKLHPSETFIIFGVFVVFLIFILCSKNWK